MSNETNPPHEDLRDDAYLYGDDEAISRALHVGELFEIVFRRALKDPHGTAYCDMPIESECGRECMRAILAGEALLAMVRQAFGDRERQLIANVIEATERTILCFIYG